MTSRLRAYAALYELAPPRPPPGQRKRGRPPKNGTPLRKLDQTAQDPATQWHTTTVRRYGKTEQIIVHPFGACGTTRSPKPVQVVIIQDTTNPTGYELALVSTDLQASAAQVIERYADRWPPEVAYEEGKGIFGVGDARNRAEKAVQQTVPFQFISMTLTIVGQRSPPPSWRRRLNTTTATTSPDRPVVRRHALHAPPRDQRSSISPRLGSRPQTRGNSARSPRIGK